MFRKIKESDKEIFLTMAREFYDSPAVLHPIKEEYHRRTFNELMRSREYLDCYIIEDGDEVAGYCLLNITFGHECGGMVIWVEELYVRDGHQGKGIGSKMLRQIEADYPNAARIRLETEHDNQGAKRFYSRLGYEVLEYEQMYKDFE